MAKRQGKIGLIISISVLLLTILVVSLIVANQRSYNASDTSSTNIDTSSSDNTSGTQQPETAETPKQEVATEPDIDESRFTTIDVEPLDISVAYEKWVPYFEFYIKRTDDGTRYAEFTYEELKGDKCSDDEGVFITIIENPSTAEDMSTIEKTTVVDGTTYGLTLASDTCTNDKGLLQRYQAAFSDGFSLLKAL